MYLGLINNLSITDLGWLAPDGRFFQVEYMEHLEKAEELCKTIYQIKEIITPDEFLMNHGWVHISQTTSAGFGLLILFYTHLTQAQKDYLKPIAIENWNWINKMCKSDLNEELELNYEVDWRN